MAYSATGTAGNDTLNQSGDTGPGTIVGLAGDDSILQGTGSATITGDSGNDIVVLQAGNTGTVDGGTENDSIFSAGNNGAMLLFLGAGADTVNTLASSGALTIVGGNDSSDGADSIVTGTGGADLILSNGGNDTIRSETGADTLVAGFGNDSVFENAVPNGNQLIFGNEGNDSVFVSPGADTVFAGLGNDSIFQGGGGGSPVWFGNEGADTMDGAGVDSATLVGGNDSADGADSLVTGTGADFVFGNGGGDTITAGAGANTVVGGFGSDSIVTLAAADLIFANETGDTVSAGDGANTVFGGLGNDSILGGAGRETIQGNEENDTIRGDAALGISIDTIAGGTGNDVFAYSDGGADGDNAAGGGPVELITDVNFDQDRFQAPIAVVFANDTGAGTGANLNEAANNALNASAALSGNAANITATTFTFGGRTFLAINQVGAGFQDATDLLLDVTGATGTIGGSDFIT